MTPPETQTSNESLTENGVSAMEAYEDFFGR
jgi:hypothetical protein